MTVRNINKSLLALALAVGSFTAAQAASQQFYADKLTADTPASARDDFLKASTEVKLEGFETAPTGVVSTPLSLYSGQGTLSQDEFSSGLIKQSTIVVNGRSNTTPNCDPVSGCKWWETPSSFEIKLTSLKSAFAFFATDLGDLGGAISLDFWNDTTLVRSGIAVTQPTQTSGLLFFGWIDDTFSFNRVSVNVSQTNVNPARFDYIGFDDVLAGVRASTGPVPTPVSAPASWGLVALGLGLLAATRRRNTRS